MITLNTTPVLSSDDLNEVIDWAVYVAKSDTNSDGQNILSIALMHGDENGSKKFRDLIIIDSGEVFLSEEY